MLTPLAKYVAGTVHIFRFFVSHIWNSRTDSLAQSTDSWFACHYAQFNCIQILELNPKQQASPRSGLAKYEAKYE